MRNKTMIALITIAGLLVTACAPTAEAPADAATVTVPPTPVGDAAQWVIDEMNAGADTTAAAWADRLSEDFLAEVSAEEVATLINMQIRPARPLIVTAYHGSETEAVVTIAGALGEPFDLSIAIDDEQHISGLLLGPVTPPRTPATSSDEVAERLGALPLTARVLVDIDGAQVIESGAEEPVPLGSIFKLYVLEALAEAVAAGEIAWDDTVTVTDAVRSLPSGELQDAPDGTVVTVQEAATKMIAISDNTATDMLIGLLGRDAVERAVARGNHHAPGMLRPFLTTREMFALMWGGHVDLQTAWSSGEETARREVLDALGARDFTVSAADVDQNAAWIDGLEWFASAQDIFELHAALAARGDADPVIRKVLAENPGILVDPDSWSVDAYKGGSNLGVLTGSWRATRTDGAVMTVIILGSVDKPIDGETEAELFGLAADLFRINAK